MKCLKCNLRISSRSGIIKGEYYPELCDWCVVSGQGESSGAASYNRQRDLEDHNADMVQPYAGGLPNPEFVKLYPERARQLFSETELDSAVRS